MRYFSTAAIFHLGVKRLFRVWGFGGLRLGVLNVWALGLSCVKARSTLEGVEGLIKLI